MRSWTRLIQTSPIVTVFALYVRPSLMAPVNAHCHETQKYRCDKDVPRTTRSQSVACGADLVSLVLLRFEEVAYALESLLSLVTVDGTDQSSWKGQ